ILPFLELLRTLSPNGKEAYDNWISLLGQIEENLQKIQNKNLISFQKGTYSQQIDKIIKKEIEKFLSIESRCFQHLKKPETSFISFVNTLLKWKKSLKS